MSAILLSVAALHAALVIAPRSYRVLRGRPCPHCRQGWLTFQGLLGHPWRTLRSKWQCKSCRAVAAEARWGRLELQPE